MQKVLIVFKKEYSVEESDLNALPKELFIVFIIGNLCKLRKFPKEKCVAF